MIERGQIQKGERLTVEVQGMQRIHARTRHFGVPTAAYKERRSEVDPSVIQVMISNLHDLQGVISL